MKLSLKNFVIVMAHPDDELFSFGAWLNQVNTIICCTYRKNHEKIRCLETICEKFDIELHFVENKPFYIDIAFTVNCIENLLTEKNILTHHPNDLHQDHKQTTLSTIEILKELNYKTKLLLYTNHLSQSQTYPLGEIGTAITLPPNKKEFYFDAVYSFCLDDNLQKDKFFALEAMHDLRNPQINISIKHSLKHLNKLIKRKLSTKDKSYYRRSIRANELFFVVDDFKEF